ncbi:hypothetical protein METP3_01695 [Methanosarcinales archaeon]|nr:hypothetical protein METP3_01695 [Methanosarcinales archaeon]
MTVVYQIEFQGENLTRTIDGNQDTSSIDSQEINHLEDTYQKFKWNKSAGISRNIGEKLFSILNGNRQTLINALNEAEHQSEYLQLVLKDNGFVSNLPFELLYHDGFLIPSHIHLIRKVSDRGKKKKLEPEIRPLKLLFMTCLPQDIYPVLELEKEEDTIFDATKNLSLDIDIEDTGSLEGLGEWLATNKYDIIHISGHADIEENGEPFFLMENGEGLPVHVTSQQLWEILNLNMPRLVFLSGCRTGEAPDHVAALSFAHRLVAGRVPAVLGWGLPVSDIGALIAAEKLYFELSRGENILDALQRTRHELFKQCSDWSLLRLFSDGTPLEVPLVKRGQKKRVTLRERQYISLESSQVKVLKKGFIGRRRLVQEGLRCLRRDENKIGLLLHGTGGLGKSSLAGKYCEHFKEHTLIVVHGELRESIFLEALKDGFIRSDAAEGEKILKHEEELPDKIKRLCYSAFLNGKYLILLDDFEKNLVGIKEGNPAVCAEAVPILETLLKYLPNSGKMTQLIITSRYTFSLGGKDLITDKLESIGLTSFREADEMKKISGLENIANYPNSNIREKLIEAGRGNPRLMEYLNTLVGEVKDFDIDSLISIVKGKQEEFVQGLILNQILESQPIEFQAFLRRCAVYRLSALIGGIGLLFTDMKDWELYIETAVRLSLMEKDSSSTDIRYLVTPLLREEIFGKLEDKERINYHKIAVSYYQDILSKAYSPVSSAELIEHALSASLPETAIEESGSRLLPYLRGSLIYKEALNYGEYIRSCIPEPIKDGKYYIFILELGTIYKDIGDIKKALEYSELALSIGKEVYGEKSHPVALSLNNIGFILEDFGKPEEAIEYYRQAFSMYREIYDSRHPEVATCLNNIGSTWYARGKWKKAIKYYERARSIYKDKYGAKSPQVAITLNNMGSAWISLGNPTKAMKNFDLALSIIKEAYGVRHLQIIPILNSIGSVWKKLDKPERAIEYFEEALSINKEVFGEIHPDNAILLNNISSAWYTFGDSVRAKDHFQQAYNLLRELYGDEHPLTRACKKQLDSFS